MVPSCSILPNERLWLLKEFAYCIIHGRHITWRSSCIISPRLATRSSKDNNETNMHKQLASYNVPTINVENSKVLEPVTNCPRTQVCRRQVWIIFGSKRLTWITSTGHFTFFIFLTFCQKQVSWTLVKATLKAQKVQTEMEYSIRDAYFVNVKAESKVHMANNTEAWQYSTVENHTT
jgi:hypothetical protein